MTFIICELSGNHHGNFDRAIVLVEEAAKAGADAIKTQCFNPETLTLDHDSPEFSVDWNGERRKLIDLYRETVMPWYWHEKLFARAQALGMKAFASVFCQESCDHIASLKPYALKIASLEIVDTPLILHAAHRQLPLILSCGMASDSEVADALDAAQEAPDVTLLHCPPDYPADASYADMKRIGALADGFQVPVGLSDHTLSTTLPAVAVGLGAVAIEKHLTLSRSIGGADAAFSLEPAEFAAMVAAVREAERAIVAPQEKREPHRELRRSLYAVTDIRKGETLSVSNIRSIRPGHGLPPKQLPFVVGRRAAIDLPRGTALKPEYVAM